jgi:hypothetical protein
LWGGSWLFNNLEDYKLASYITGLTLISVGILLTTFAIGRLVDE